MKNAIQTNSHRNQQHKLGYFVPLSLLLALLIVQPVFAQQKGTFKDSRDGKTYKTTKIGEQVWMAENLSFNAKGSKCYDNKPANCQKYGRLYDQETAKAACPSGWYLPSNAEWYKLFRYVDANNDSKSSGENLTDGKYLKAKSGWKNTKGESGNGTDIYGFAALPGGSYSTYFNDRTHFFYFNGLGEYAFWWSSNSLDEENDAHYFDLGYTADFANGLNLFLNDYYYKSFLCSVRCIQEATVAKTETFKPSFNCSKASTPTEKAICSNAELAELDATMAEDYKCLLKIDGDNRNQKGFLKERDQCGAKVECIKAAYENRFDEFRISTGAMHRSCGYSGGW